MLNRLETAIVVAAMACLPCFGAARAEPITLKETGSTLIFPLFKVWAETYGKTHPGVSITTDSTGSGRGIAAAIDGSAEIGASDAFMSNEQAAQHPNILNIATAISAEMINYNLPGVAQPLRLDGPTLVGIYTGKIRSWDDKLIVGLNPGLSLPHHEIIPLHRADGSGDTFVFTQFLSFTTAAPEAVGFISVASSWATSPGFGTSIDWPHVAEAQAANGNKGVLELLQKTPYAIAYLGITFEDEVKRDGLGTAMMKSYSGQFLLPNRDTITAAAASLTPRTPDDERLTLVNAPGDDCYPLINYEYVMVSETQAKSKNVGALRNFLFWAIAPDEGNANILADQHLIPLPAHIWVKSHDQIERIRRQLGSG